ncbi:MAG: PqiC family protein, partial [Desulfobacterales bacterium]
MRLSKQIQRLALTIALTGLWTAAACMGPSPQVQYYTLAPLAAEERGAAWDGAALLAVGPVSLPKVLDRPHMATQSGDNRVVFAETHRWAGSLQEEIARVVADNLSILLNSDQIIATSDEGLSVPGHRIIINIQRFIAQPNGEVVLELLWTLKQSGREQSSVLQKSTIRRPLESPGYDGIAAAQSAALGDLSREMAAYIRR